MLRSPRLAAVLALLLLAASQVAYALLAGPLVALVAAVDPGAVPPLPILRAVVAGGGVAIGALGLALVALAGAAGTATGHRWGWVAGVAASVLWLPSGCFPVALLALGVLLHPSVRGPAWAAPPPPPPSEPEPREEYA